MSMFTENITIRFYHFCCLPFLNTFEHVPERFFQEGKEDLKRLPPGTDSAFTTNQGSTNLTGCSKI
jgi:hypothetical protein